MFWIDFIHLFDFEYLARVSKKNRPYFKKAEIFIAWQSKLEILDEFIILITFILIFSPLSGIRLCKASKYRYLHRDMADLEKQLITACEGK